MYEVILLILPGFASLYYVLRNKKIQNPESNQWILLPVLAFYSLLSLFISFLFVQFIWFLIQKSLPLCFLNQISLYKTELTFSDKTFSTITIIEFIFSFFIAYFLPSLKNLFIEFTKYPEIFKFLEELHSGTESPIMIDLKDKRTYIGFLVSGDKWSNNHNTIQIKPMISCYRTDGKLKVHSLFMIKDENGKFVEEFKDNQEIIFMLNEISSIRKIDMSRFFIHLVNYDFAAEDSVYKKLGIPEKPQQ